jgi:hypothetical protein
LEKIAIKPGLSTEALAKVDIYLIYWLAQLVPVYDSGGLHQSVVSANKWVEKYLMNGIIPYEMSEKYKVESKKGGRVIKKLLEKMWGDKYGDLLESQAKGVQQAKMKMNNASLQNVPDTRVVISDSMLKFHEKDRRVEYRDKWVEKCKSFNI